MLVDMPQEYFRIFLGLDEQVSHVIDYVEFLIQQGYASIQCG